MSGGWRSRRRLCAVGLAALTSVSGRSGRVQAGRDASEVVGCGACSTRQCRHILCLSLPRASLFSSLHSRHRLMTKEPQFGSDTTEENKRRALEALASRGSRHDAATAAGVSLKTLDDWRWRDDQFAAEWDATIERVMTRLREHPLDDKGNLKRSPLQYGLKATDENKEIVLAMLANGATYAAAAAAIGAHRRTIIKWPERDEEFAERWRDAIEEGIDKLEDEAIRRARDGVKRPVFYMGQVVGYVQEYSDSLLKFLLEAKRPAVYRARNINLIPPDGSDGVLEVRWKGPEPPGSQETPA
jgi:transposase-like protein